MLFWRLSAFFVVFAALCHSAVYAAGEPQGFATYTEGNSDLYLAALFTPKRPDGSPDFESVEPKRIEIKILADRFSYRRFRRHFVHRTAINNSQKRLQRSAKDLEDFLGWFNQPLSRGDHIVVEQKGRSVNLIVNSDKVGSLNSPWVFDIMQNAWIGDTPPSLHFKSQLLGQKDSTEAREFFYQLEAEASRKSLARLMREQASQLQADRDSEKASKSSDLTQKLPSKAKAVKAAPKVVPKKKAPKVTKAAPKKVTKKIVKKTAVKKPTPVKTEPKVARLTPEELAAKEQIIRENYADRLRKHALENIKYSSNSRPPRYEDTLKATLVIDRSGKLVSFKFVDQSIFDAVNRDIKKSVRRAEPYPMIPADIPGNTFTFELTIVVRSQ